MIDPIVTEAEWRPILHSLPEWRCPIVPVVVISPHPDDETLATGGLIATLSDRNLDTTVVAVTDGESAYEDVKGLGEARKDEQKKALQILGVRASKTVRFGMPDSGVSAHHQKLVDNLLTVVSPGSHILAPWCGDFHPDHEACGRAAEEVSRLIGARLTYYFFWTWHRGAIDHLAGKPIRKFPLSVEAMCAKTEALLCHESQLHRNGGDPILPERLLGPARRPFEVYLDA